VLETISKTMIAFFVGQYFTGKLLCSEWTFSRQEGS
jgi:hypothetical protein